ncbi:MAG: RDD family protein [Chloroflexi bacterium]|nr:RDD family protein [Chloroflexota bacterium]
MLVLRRMAAYVLDIIGLFVLLAPPGQAILWLVGTRPQSGPAIAQTILWNFSLPVWIYFIVSDASATGATIGKRLLGIKVSRMDSARLNWPQALLRTAMKLLPWELVHVAAFALSTDLTQVRRVQQVGLALANLLIIVYLLLVWFSRGQRSLHDYVAGTLVRLAHQSGRSRR